MNVFLENLGFDNWFDSVWQIPATEPPHSWLVSSWSVVLHSKYIPTKSCLQSAWIRAVQDPKFPAWYHPGLIEFPVWYHPGRFNFPAWYHPAFSTTISFTIFSESSCFHPGLFADQDGNRATRLKRPNHPRCLTTLIYMCRHSNCDHVMFDNSV